MATFNKAILVGRLTRDPEVRPVGDSRVAKFTIAVNNRKKDNGQWVDDPIFIACEAWNNSSGGRRLADTVEQYVKKGSQILVEGSLKLDTWVDKQSGQKRERIVIVVRDVQFLDDNRSRSANGGSEEPRRQEPTRAPKEGPSPDNSRTPWDNEEDIPF